MIIIIIIFIIIIIIIIISLVETAADLSRLWAEVNPQPGCFGSFLWFSNQQASFEDFLIGGGNSNTFLNFHPKPWGRFRFWLSHIFQMGWFNHQLVSWSAHKFSGTLFGKAAGMFLFSMQPISYRKNGPPETGCKFPLSFLITKGFTGIIQISQLHRDLNPPFLRYNWLLGVKHLATRDFCYQQVIPPCPWTLRVLPAPVASVYLWAPPVLVEEA